MQLRIKTLLLLFFCTCMGCATAQFLPTDESVKYQPTDSIKIYTEEPEQPYKIIGRVVAQGKRGDFNVNEKTVFKKLKREAMAVGAHAIIMRGTGGEAGSVIASEIYGSAASGYYVPDYIRYKGIAIRFIEEE